MSDILNKPEMKKLLASLGRPFRSDLQRNSIGEADCEIIQISADRYLASTIDTISEEVLAGLYRSPYTAGWVTIAASLSDLAAAGVEPLGLMLSVIWPADKNEEYKREFFAGAHAICEQSGVGLLGGDQGQGRDLVASSVGIGISTIMPLKRSGAQVGDELILFGDGLGVGPLLAVSRLMGLGNSVFHEDQFRPSPNPKLMHKIRQNLSSSVDTSDGLIGSCLDICHSSQISISLNWDETCIEPMALEFCKKYELPKFLCWLGEHGDFQVLATAPQGSFESFRKDGLRLHKVGMVRTWDEQSTLTLEIEGKALTIDPNWARFSQEKSFQEMAMELKSFNHNLRSLGFH